MKYKLTISGMHCASCAIHVEDDLKKKDGIQEARVNFTLEQGEVSYDESNEAAQSVY